jgi:hypothetical protein
MQTLDILINQLEASIPKFEKYSATISKSNIGWHIDHALMVLIGIIDTTSKSDPSIYKWEFNFKRFVVMARRKIPRGKAKAPKSVIPKGDYNLDSLKNKIAIAKSKLEELMQMPSNKYFPHPGLGNMKLKQTIKFLEIHTSHHLRIIEEIGRSEE